MKIKFTLLLVLTLLQVAGFAQAPEFTIHGSEVRKVMSTSVAGQEYELDIMLPAGYQNSTKKFPVLYLMDSQWDFPLVTALYGQQYYDGFIPPMIIVGITWGGANPAPDSLRARDYTPTNEKRLPQSGGAARYLSFIKNEVFPFIEKSYKADSSNRTLMGCSLGGLFTLYTLFTEPELFQFYIAASPAFAWDNEVLYQFEKKYDEGKSHPPARLFMCVGGVEHSVPGFEKLTRHLLARRYANLHMQTKVLENTGHSGTKGEGYARGLQWVFEKPSIEVAPAVLSTYAGSYTLENGTPVQLKAENKGLVLYVYPTEKYTLLATSETDFYTRAGFIKIHIDKDTNNKATGFQLETYGGTQKAKKSKPKQ